MALDDVPRCQHVKVNGTQCGSPALRRRRFCFFHDKARREHARIAAEASAQHQFDLPLLEDANSVQVALMKVVQMLGSGKIDHKTAGLMLYALQTASINLRNTDFEAAEVTDVVIDRDTVAATCIHGPQWFEDDFGSADEEEGETEVAAGAENGANVAQPNSDPAAKPDAKNDPKNEVKHVGLEEARKQVQGAIRNWVAENVAQKPQ